MGGVGEEQQEKETQENCSVTWLSSLRFYGNRISFPLFPVNHSDLESFRGAHITLPRWILARKVLEDGRTMHWFVVSLLDLSRIL